MSAAHTFLRGASLLLTGSTVIPSPDVDYDPLHDPSYSPSYDPTNEINDDYHRFLITGVDSEGNPLEERPATRIGDIGVGTIVFLLINICYIGVCCFGSMIAKPGCLYVSKSERANFSFDKRSARSRRAYRVGDANSCASKHLYSPCTLLTLALSLRYFWGTFFYVIVIVFLFEATRTSRWVTEEEVLNETDPYFNSRLFMMLFFIWCSCWTCCYWTMAHLAPQVQGKAPEDASEQEGFTRSRPMF